MSVALHFLLSLLFLFEPQQVIDTISQNSIRAVSPQYFKKTVKKKKPRPACNDHKDNDRDGLIDYPADPGCRSKKDKAERNPVKIIPTPRATPPANNDLTTGMNVSLHGRRIFPADNAWNRDVSADPVDPNSAALLSSIGLQTGLHPDFGTTWEGSPIGFDYLVVAANELRLPMTFTYKDESDAGPYPIPLNAPIEGGNNSQGDRHVLVIDKDNWTLYETYNSHIKGSGWYCDSGAIFDLNSNLLRPAGWTSADAAGLPIFPGLVRYDEVVELQEITHALRFTVSRSRRAYVSPARHYASNGTDSNLPPMGMRVRLKSNFDISRFPANVQVILRAMKKYGMIVADNGSNWFVSGAHDPRWDDEELSSLKSVKGGDFEVIKMEEIVTK